MRRDASFLASQYFGYVFPYTRPLYCDAEPSLACISTFFSFNLFLVTYFYIRAQNIAWASTSLLASWCFFIVLIRFNIAIAEPCLALFFDVFFSCNMYFNIIYCRAQYYLCLGVVFRLRSLDYTALRSR